MATILDILRLRLKNKYSYFVYYKKLIIDYKIIFSNQVFIILKLN